MEPTPPSSSGPSPERQPRRWRRGVSIGLILGVALGGGLVAASVSWRVAIRQPGPLAEARAVVVARGGVGQLAETLASAGVIGRPLLFRAAAWLSDHDGPLRAAEFVFPAHASIDQVLGVLRTARPVEHHLTIPEGLTAQQTAIILARATATTGEVPRFDEGSILPQTYDYQYGTNRFAIIARARLAMERALNAAWAERAPGLPLASRREAVILASIVERETARPEERAHVAAVYLNRLRLGMKLQADPTVIYLASGGAGVLDHRLTRAELGRDDPFNTYRSAGLPPAPICSPGLDALQAVLHPAASDDLFFVADGSGGHVFSRTYEAHDAAVARWRAQTQAAPHDGSEMDAR